MAVPGSGILKALASVAALTGVPSPGWAQRLCPTLAERQQIARACAQPGPICDLLRDSILQQCRAGPAASRLGLQPIRNPCGAAASCTNPVGRGGILYPDELTNDALSRQLGLDRSRLSNMRAQSRSQTPGR
jgi:hypothetical protein